MIFASMLAAAAATASPSAFTGDWICRGRFVRSGRPLAATIKIRAGSVTGSLTVDHRDMAPGQYQTSEIWWLSVASARAAIVDGSGMRWFDGQVGDRMLTFTRSEGSAPLEEFAYRLTTDGLSIDWSHRGATGSLDLGDTLTCIKA